MWIHPVQILLLNSAGEKKHLYIQGSEPLVRLIGQDSPRAEQHLYSQVSNIEDLDRAVPVVI